MQIHILVLIVAAVVAAGLLGTVLLLMARLRETAREKVDIEGEEHRMFGFLQLLGQAIADDFASRMLFRVIVDGIEEVLRGRGAALYLVSQDGEYLVPAYLSERCPPLFEISAEKRAELGDDVRGLASFLRLAKVPAGGGMLWECMEAGKARWEKGLPGSRRLEGEAMIAPVTHAGRDLGVLVVVGERGVRTFSENDYDVFRSLAGQSAFALGNSIIHQEAAEKRRMERELRVARDVQQVLLPSSNPKPAGYRIHGTNVPARIISGDYYDYLDLPGDRLGVVIADVSGKGVSAGLMMATCRSALRSVAGEHESPSAALAAVNRQLFQDMREDMFISMAYLIFERSGESVRLARAGHEAPLLLRKEGGGVETLKPGGLAIGIDEGPVFERVTSDLEIELRSGDCLLLYTDGVNEAENGKGAEFGRERLEVVFQDSAKMGAERAVLRLLEELKRFVDGHRQMDDITMIAIEKR